MNHGSFIDDDIIQGLTKPLLINASIDLMISHEKIATFQGILNGKKDVPSDIKVRASNAYVS